MNNLSASDLNATWTPSSEFTGNAILTLTTTNGCSTPATSTRTVTVNNVTLNNTITNTQNTLSATENDANYQWIRCDQGNAPVAGATSQSFIPQTSGNYAVILTAPGCQSVTTTSICILVNRDNLGIPGTLQVAGISEFEKKVTMREGLVLEGVQTDTTTVSDSTGLSFLVMKKDDGTVVKKDLFTVVNMAYQPQFCFTDVNGNIANPTWQNGPNKLFSRCPEVFVGIGTNTPTHSLHNMGDTKLEGELTVGGNMAIGNATIPSSFSKFKIRNTNMNVGLELDNSGLAGNYKRLFYLQYTNPTTEIMRVVNSTNNHVPFLLETSGQMTIKSETNTILMLTPDGMLRARRVKIDADAWADYVFEPNYELMPLDELGLFLSKNKHLPNIPSEKEVKENGIDLAQMNMLLLEKVEQLTLYLIEQDKRNQLQDEVISKLQQELSKKN